MPTNMPDITIIKKDSTPTEYSCLSKSRGLGMTLAMPDIISNKKKVARPSFLKLFRVALPRNCRSSIIIEGFNNVFRMITSHQCNL